MITRDTIIGQRLSQVEGVSQVFISGAAKSPFACKSIPARWPPPA